MNQDQNKNLQNKIFQDKDQIFQDKNQIFLDKGDQILQIKCF